jgi:hypothetical protein
VNEEMGASDEPRRDETGDMGIITMVVIGLTGFLLRLEG